MTNNQAISYATPRLDEGTWELDLKRNSSSESQHLFSGFGLRDPQPPPNQSFQRTQQSVTRFASAKPAPLCCAAELRR